MKVKAVKVGRDPDDHTVGPAILWDRPYCGTGFLAGHDRLEGLSHSCNDITRHIPDEAMIVDDLRQMREARGNTSTGEDNYGILRWAGRAAD